MSEESPSAQPPLTKSIFYLRSDAPVKFLAPAYDDSGKIHIWIPRGNDSFQVIHPFDIVEGAYFARTKQRETDFFFPFYAGAVQKAVSQSHHQRLNDIVNDVSNLATSIEKLGLFYRSKDPGASAFARTEIEYISIVCRSLYDLCQEIIAEWWGGITLKNDAVKKRQLKKSFADMVLVGNAPRTAESYATFGLPQPWIEFYIRSTSFFVKLRNLRDGIVHRGTELPLIYAGAPGFSVPVKDRLFLPFDVWKPQHLLKNDLGSLKTLVSYWIIETLRVSDSFMETMQNTIQMPADIAPGYSVFLRGAHINHLNRLAGYLENGWEDA